MGKARTLVVAHEQLVEWLGPSTGRAIAEIVGVSRPTIYAEFGNKEGIAEALVLAETNRFLIGVQERLDPELR